MPKSRRRITKKPKSRKRRAAQEEGWFTIRRILDEREVNGQVEYLVDWDDNVVTGEAYTPTWSIEVTHLARKEWEDQKSKRADQEHQLQSASIEDSDLSQPPRPANWRKLPQQSASNLARSRSRSSSPSTSQRPCKVRRIDTAISLSEDSAPSFVTSSTVATPSEVIDVTYLDYSSDRLRETSVVVEIPPKPNFDPADFISIHGSQETEHSSLSLSELENEDNRVPVLPQSQKTVPDSQEVSFPSWFEYQSLEKRASPAPAADQSLQPSQPSSAHCVIPDSLEPVGNTASQSPKRGSIGLQSPSGSCRGSAHKTVEDLVEESSQTVASDIPSHQLDRLEEAAESQDQVVLDLASREPSIAHSVPAAVSSPSPAVPEPTQADRSPVFLTQPPLATALHGPESSEISQVLESPYTTVGSISSLNAPQTYLPDPRESQAAQPVRQGLELIEIQLTDSESRGKPLDSQFGEGAEGPASDNSGSRSNLISLLNPLPAEEVSPTSEVPVNDLSQRAPERSPSLRNTEKQGEPTQDRTMEGDGSNKSDQKRRLTLEEELAEIFRIDDPKLRPAMAGQSQSGEASAVPSATAPVQKFAIEEISCNNDPPESVGRHSEPIDAGISQGIGAKSPTHEVVECNSGETLKELPEISNVTDRRRSLAEELHDIFNAPLIKGGFGPLSPPLAPAPADSSQPDEPQLVTVSLAEVSRQVEPEYNAISLADISQPPAPEYRNIPLMPSVPSQEILASDPQEGDAIPLHGANTESEHRLNELTSSSQAEPAFIEHIVTLPFQASRRPFYDDAIVEFKDPIQEYSRIFSSEEYTEPEDVLVKKIEELFNDLFNVCDYPPDVIGTVLEELSPSDLTKYCCDANPKFLFIYELLKGIRTKTKVLIIARSRDLLRLLCHLAEALRIQFSCEATGKSNNATIDSDASAMFALPSDKVNSSKFDVVIGFDHHFNGSYTAQQLAIGSTTKQQPVLLLVTTHSIEHIVLQVPDDLPVTERKNVILSAVVRARRLVTDPERGCLEPHEIATLFLEFINEQAEEIMWDPVPVPEEVLDVYINSQSRSQMPLDLPEDPDLGRKRKFDDSDDSDAKRVRVFPTKDITAGSDKPPLSDEVTALLEAGAPTEPTTGPQVLVPVSLSVLTALAEKFSDFQQRIDAADCESEYKGVISGLEKRLKEYERTTRKVYNSQRAALQDRHLFEVEKRKVEIAKQEVTEQAEKEAEKARKRISELESAVARLTEDPQAFNPQDSPLAKTEKLLQEAQAKVGILEKRLENSHNDAEYVRSIYQDASTTASALKSENSQLKKQNEDLSKKASDNFVRIHEIQEQSTVNIYLGQIAELKAQVKEREIEIDHAREELRQLKNGRRETRQVSVPRSPRMGMMSPRTIARNYGGSASRGSSPAPAPGVDGMQFFGQPPGNGRWNHLREY